MISRLGFPIVCLVLALPLTAAAQSDDATYCKQLSDLYRRTSPTSATPDVVVPTAIAKCDAGDTSEIPIIEKALKDSKVNLPSRG